MFSQLCRARPGTLWDKFAVGQRVAHEVEARPEVNGCRLEQCAFCDYRVCCRVIPESSSTCDWESEQEQVTDNPAYGLSSENWLELDEDDVNGMERTPDEPRPTSQTMNHAVKIDEGVSFLRSRPLDLQKRPFPLSLMRPATTKQQQQQVSRQRPVQRNARVHPSDAPKRPQADPLSEMGPIRTEESIQEWLARIGESSAWQEDEPKETTSWTRLPEDTEAEGKDCRYRAPEEGGDALRGASKASPANVPMVVMQCSRLHSHLGPPFQQTSLPMGTLVTALYREADWLYVQTPHGVEGFVASANCAPIGSANDPQGHTSRRPWEPCDFPIRVASGSRRLLGSHPQGVPEGGAYVSTVRMKTSFYGDRYLSHTFKPKDSIKTAKTVTDILRSSPETKVTANQ